MTFQFRRRGEVRDQSSQEPFFQNTQEQSFVDSAPYPQMGHPQGFDPRQHPGFQTQPQPQQNQMQGGPQTGQMQQQPYFQNTGGNFYGQNPMYNQQSQYEAQQMLNQAPGQPYGMAQPQMPNQQNFNTVNDQAPFTHPIRASQMGSPQMTGSANFQGFNSPQQQSINPSAHPYGPEDVRSLSFMQNQSAHTGFDSLDIESDGSSPVRLLVAVAGIALVAGLSWFAYKWAKSPSSDTPPLIHAEAGPHKVSPDHRGGLNIPYQDKLIYDRIGDEQQEGTTERLLPPPEKPTMMETQQAPQQTGQNTEQSSQEPMYREAPAEASVGQRQQGYGAQAKQYKKVETDVENQPKPQEELADTNSENEPEVIKKTKATQVINGKFFVQLATLKSEAIALKEWKRIQAKYNLKGMKSQIKETETPDGEIVYRLLMGPFDEKVKALEFAVKIDGTKVVLITA